MELVFQELLRSLEGLQSFYQQILELSREKQLELVKGNLDGIDALTKKEEKLVFEAGRLEEERYQKARQLFSYYELSENTALKDLIDAAPEEVKTNLQNTAERLIGLTLEIERTNKQNIDLIHQSLNFINFTVDMLTKEDQAAVYSADPEKTPAHKIVSRIYDKKI